MVGNQLPTHDRVTSEKNESLESSLANDWICALRSVFVVMFRRTLRDTAQVQSILNLLQFEHRMGDWRNKNGREGINGIFTIKFLHNPSKPFTQNLRHSERICDVIRVWKKERLDLVTVFPRRFCGILRNTAEGQQLSVWKHLWCLHFQ